MMKISRKEAFDFEYLFSYILSIYKNIMEPSSTAISPEGNTSIDKKKKRVRDDKKLKLLQKVAL